VLLLIQNGLVGLTGNTLFFKSISVVNIIAVS